MALADAGNFTRAAERMFITQPTLSLAGAWDMVRVSLEARPLTATAALVWNGELPGPLQQILFDTADAFSAADISGMCSADSGNFYTERSRLLALSGGFRRPWLARGVARV